MMIEGSNSSSALGWVRDDLDECLDSVRENLEAYADDMSQREPLLSVQEALEQLNLTFLTMEQNGAGILTDEMIAVGGHMLHNGAADCEDSLNALTDAVIVLPSYLDRLQAGHEDLPILLLPTLNELRATYDESLLSEGTLFAPELDVIIPELSGSEADAIASTDFEPFARRVRNEYQGALLGWLQEQSRNDLLQPMQDVCQKLTIRLGRLELRRLWWIAEMVMQGLREGSIDNDLPLRRLFARLDLTLKAMAEQGEYGAPNETVTALSRALLFYAAQARPGSKATDKLRERFILEDLIPDREALLRARGAVTGRDAQLFRSIGDAVREELSQVKDTLDMELRTGRVDEEQRSQSMTSLRQLADTLDMLNLPVPARAVEDLLPALEDTGDGDIMDLDSPLLGLAQKLLQVEAILDTHIQLLGEPVEEEKSRELISLNPQEQRHILSQLLDECVSNLHEVQEAIHKRLDGDREVDYATPLEQISGALSVASQSEVAALTEKLCRTLNASLSNPEGGVENLEALSDAVAALELYLAGCRDEQSNSLKFLEVMHSRLDGLPEADSGGEEIEATKIVLPQRAAPQPGPPESTPQPSHAAAGMAATAEIDPAMLGIFLEEFDGVRAQMRRALPAWLDDTADGKALADMCRGFHTLKGSGRMVGATEIGEFSWQFEDLLKKLIEQRIEFNETLGETVRLAVGALGELRARLLGEDSELTDAAVKSFGTFARMLAGGNRPNLSKLESMLPTAVLSPAPEEPGTKRAEAEPAALDELLEPGHLDPTLRQLMAGEIPGYLAELESLIQGLGSGSSQAVGSVVVRAVHTLAGTFSMAPLGQESEVASALENYLNSRLKAGKPVPAAAGPTLQTCLHRFHQRLSVLQDDNTTSYPLDDAQLLSELAGLAELEDQVSEEVRPEPSEPESAAAEEKPDAAPVLPDKPEADPDRIDIEEGGIISIFLEEAVEVLERCDTLLNTWRDKLSDRKLVQNLQREIHTFKGGARMAGLEVLGELSHAMETLLEHIASGRLEATVAAVQSLEEGCDRLNIWVEQLQSRRMPKAGDALTRFRKKVQALQLPQTEDFAEPADLAGAVPELRETETDEPAVEAPSEPAIEAPEAAKSEPASSPAKKVARKRPKARKPAQRRRPEREFHEIQDRPTIQGDEAAPGAQIRVAAELMDKLVNYSGEISIYRSRLEQQLGHVRFNLEEVDGTVQRLKEQLRKMDIESEAQMMSRYEKASTKNSSEFDPLELDRFSNMQQLSRALAESVSDLINLHEMLDDSVRQADSLLTQQSRVSSDLQEGLMQTRMTPFGSAAPRLRRVVRAAAAETGKQARLQLRMAGSSDQLDRNVLERITAPLEHMLRNAIAHGIESPKARRKAGKPEEGDITVTVEAEATEFVIRVEDDGGGINLDAVRKRAIERGVLDKDENPDPQTLVQFIRHSGFSTSQTVTGLAGRGVGMDVVNNEIKQIGGSMEIETERGKGTVFTIRIPFSLAVMQAIAVSIDDRPFQIPLNSVAGVSRVNPSEYTALLRSEDPSYEFAGELYPLLELEPLLGAPTRPLDRDNVSLLMIRTGDQQAAFRVSGLQGHQEVVIKPVGPQISSIPGILGGTIAADGQVMIILDMGPLIRQGMELERTDPVAEVVETPREKSRQPLVMVVDDSITMRKVTSRVLDNHSVEVMTAQDGLDAIEQLQDRVPDLMLLDIEMPRMDGYELLEHVRADARLRHVPVIMITSRAGQKHRRKARKAGANSYLTKPYQENELVEEVGAVLNMELIPRRSD